MDSKQRFFAQMNEEEESPFPIKTDDSEPDDIDIDFSVSESGRTVAHLVEGAADGFHMDQIDGMDRLDGVNGMEISITDTARTADLVTSSEGSRQQQLLQHHHYQPSGGSSSSVSSISNLHINSSRTGTTPTSPALPPLESSPPSSPIQLHQQNQLQAHVQPQPMTVQSSSMKSAPRPIPKNGTSHHVDDSIATASSTQQQQSGSAGSTGSNFMSHILNGSSSLSNHSSNHSSNDTLSRTPPTQLATPYEILHFGKRPRAGSVSERLRAASELEEKGVIDREQKGIMKDLIISGDNKLQLAIDKYDKGDRTMLKEFIQSGALSNKATHDIDILGDLDLDFLTVDDEMEEQAVHQLQNGLATATRNVAIKQQQQRRQQQQQQQMTDTIGETAGETTGDTIGDTAGDTTGDTASTVTPHLVTSDGIGELEFGGELGTSATEFLSSINGTRSRSGSVLSLEPSVGTRSRSNSTWSIEPASARTRSNSLFSALIGVASQQQQENEHYGRWMETPLQKRQAAQGDEDDDDEGDEEDNMHEEDGDDDIDHGQNDEDDELVDTIAPLLELGAGAKMPTTAAVAKRKKAGNLSKLMISEPPVAPIDPMVFDTTGMTPRQVRAEQKRREKEEKQRIKREKKEKKERLKREKEKKKKKSDQQKEVERVAHVPGSGLPRCLSDPSMRRTMDQDGLLNVERPDDWVGAYSPSSRKVRIQRFLLKRNNRVWTKTVKYDVRKNFADSRLRVKGRFVKKEDELMMRELMSLT